MKTQELQIHLDILGNLEPIEATVVYDVDWFEALGRYHVTSEDYETVDPQEVVVLKEIIAMGIDILPYLSEDAAFDIREEMLL